MTIKFGTDGWRGIIAQDFTFDNVRACAQGVAQYMKEKGIAERGLLVGYDTRFASEDFAAASAEVVAANGIRVYLCEKFTPTPVVSHGVREMGTGGAIIITASHNPAIWNGFKYKAEYASSASPEIIRELEGHISIILSRGGVKQIPLTDGLKMGSIQYVDLSAAYLDRISVLVDLERIRKAGLRLVVDSMYGAGAGYFKALISGGSTELLEINGERNPLFPGIQPEPIARNLTRLSAIVKERWASVGLATDGDADRIGVIDERGEFISPLQLFALLALYLLEVRGERGPIIKTVTTTSMLNRLGELFDVPVYETPVGFKYVAPKMMEKNAILGGEESSGFAFRGHIPDRDGILAGLFFLDLMITLGKTPSQLVDHLFERVGPHYYRRIDLDLPAGEREGIAARIASTEPERIDGTRVKRKDAIDGFRFLLEDNAWLLIRFSGTEPLLRIYAEGDSQGRVNRLLEAGKEMVGIHD